MKNKNFKSNNSNNKKNNDNKSAFKVDPGRAKKAKKGQAFVKFNKSKSQSMNRDLITKLNNNLTPLQMAVRNGPEVNEMDDKQFVNPVRESFEQNLKVDQDINDAIQQLTDAF